MCGGGCQPFCDSSSEHFPRSGFHGHHLGYACADAAVGPLGSMAYHESKSWRLVKFLLHEHYILVAHVLNSLQWPVTAIRGGPPASTRVEEAVEWEDQIWLPGVLQFYLFGFVVSCPWRHGHAALARGPVASAAKLPRHSGHVYSCVIRTAVLQCW